MQVKYIVAAAISAGVTAATAIAQTGGATVIPGIGAPRSVNQIPSVGLLIEGIQIAIAPGRKDFAPRAVLVYTSMSGSSEVGVGWRLDIGKIERSTAHGVPSLAPDEEFAFSFGGTGAELVPVGGGDYRARIESAYRQFRFASDSWTMVDNQGITYHFGTTAASRVGDVSWSLDRIEDRNGNTIRYAYERDGDLLYVSEIRYTGHAPTGDLGFNRLTFAYEDRPDQRVSYSLGVRQEMRRRLVSISSSAGDRLVRRYLLDHVQSPVNGRSLLERVTVVGADDATSVRARQYGYRTRTPGWATATLTDSIPLAFNADDGVDLGVRVADVNGDGFLDLVDNGSSVYLSDGAGGFARSATWSASLNASHITFVDGDGVDTGGRLLDVNGDLKPDLLVARPGRRAVYLNDGTRWVSNPSFTTSLSGISAAATVERRFLEPDCTPEDEADPGDPTCEDLVDHIEQFAIVDSGGDSKGVQLADVNGDGLVDMLWSVVRTEVLFELATSVPISIHAVYLNTGSGWARHAGLSAALDFTFVRDSRFEGYDTIDVNGDGLVDVVRTLSTQPRRVFLGTGAGWTADAAFSASLAATAIISLDGDRKSQGLFPIDFNDDGLIDYLRADESVVAAYRNTGRGWELDGGVTAQLAALGVIFADGDGLPSGVLPGDVNGDGIADLLQSKAGSANAIRLGLGAVADLLVSAETALGEVTSVAYTPSTVFDHTGGDGIHDLPLVLQVPVRLTRSDGRGHEFVTTYAYAAGRYDGALRGFGETETTDPRGARTRAVFHQAEPLVGQVAVEEVLDTDGSVRSRKTTTYDTVSPVAGVTQVRTVRTDDEMVDPGGSLHTRTRTGYDAFLNQVEVLKDGDVTVSGDESRTEYTRAINLAAGITSLPSRITVRGAGGALLSRSIILYDGLPEGSVDRGNPTTTRDLVQVGGAAEVARTLTYDAYGNVTSATEREGNLTTFLYDDELHTYMVRTTDPEGRVLRSEFDVRWGLATRDVDASGNATIREYDLFGRLIAIGEPGDECSPQPTKSIVYSPIGSPTTQFVRVALAETPGEAGTLDTTSYFDAFAQVYRIESESEYGVPVVVTTEFDDAGYATSISRPFFAGDPARVSLFGYDALHRPVRVVEPDGIAQTLVYAGKRVDVIDRRGNPIAFVKDAYGKVTDVIETVGATAQHTRYAYDAFGRPVIVTNALGEVTRIAYDALGRRTRLDDPNAGSFIYAYDGNGNLIEQTDPADRITRFTYNRAGQLLRKRFPDGRSDLFLYGDGSVPNATGRVTRVIDAAGVLQLRYDPRGNVVMRRRLVDEDRYVTGMAYDSMNRLRRVNYPDGFEVRYQYNAAGYVDRVTDGSGRAIVDDIDYTAAGQIAAIRYGNAVASSYGYDSLARLTAISTENEDGDRLQDLGYAYDPVGNIVAIDDGAFGRSQAFGYDELNRLVHATGPYGDEAYRYDAIGNLVKKGSLLFAIDDTHKQRVTCGIDLGLLISPANGIINNPHLRTCADALMDPSHGHRPDDRAAVGVIKARGVENNPHIGSSFSVTYDVLGNVVEKNGQRLFYDSENHLVRIDQPNGQLVEENVYDAAGARVIQRTLSDQRIFIDDLFEVDHSHASRHVRVGALLVATIVTPRSRVELIDDVGDDPLTVCAAGPSGGGGGGCLAVAGGSTRGQAGLGVVLILGAVLLTRRRSRLGARVREIVAHGARRPGTTGLVLVLVPTYLLQAIGPARAAAPPEPPPEQRFYYHLDHLGSTTVVSDERGAIIEERSYKPFGEQYVRTGAEGGPRQLEISFNGHRWDEDSGLYYFLARHYDPSLGRFLSADTVVPDPSDPKAFHRYAFNYNNPIRYVDPTGHGFTDWIGSLVVWVLLAVVVIAAILLITIGTGGFGTPFAAAVIWGAVIGAAIGGIVGVAAASFMGFHPWDRQFWEVVVAGVIVGAFVGAALGSVTAFAGGAAAATAGQTLASYALIGAASGSLFGGLAGLKINKGITNDFAMDFLLGGAVGAGLVLGAGYFSHILPATLTWPAAGGIVLFMAGISYQYCRSVGACSPVDPTRSSVGSLSAASYDTNGPLDVFGGFLPGWVFQGTVVDQFRHRGPDVVLGGRVPFQTMPLAP